MSKALTTVVTVFNIQSALSMSSGEQHLKEAFSSPTSYQYDWKASVVDAMTPLARDFTPGRYDVIFSRGKKTKAHAGNRFFQSLIEQSAAKYGSAEGKLGKSIIVSEIIDTVRKKSPQGGFVKLDGDRWFEVGDAVARERTGQSLRDALAGKYRSSASSKKRRREESNAKMLGDLDALIESNSYVSKRMRCLSHSIETTKEATVSDISLMSVMTQANTDILHQLKRDKVIQDSVETLGKGGLERPSEGEGEDSKKPPARM